MSSGIRRVSHRKWHYPIKQLWINTDRQIDSSSQNHGRVHVPRNRLSLDGTLRPEPGKVGDLQADAEKRSDRCEVQKQNHDGVVVTLRRMDNQRLAHESAEQRKCG